MLDEIIIESLISAKNDLGRAIWKDHFLEKVCFFKNVNLHQQSNVDWRDFLIIFSKRVAFSIPKDPDDIQMQCLKELLGKKGSYFVVHA
jgi:hypothetical protein